MGSFEVDRSSLENRYFFKHLPTLENGKWFVPFVYFSFLGGGGDDSILLSLRLRLLGRVTVCLTYVMRGDRTPGFLMKKLLEGES